MPEAKHTIWLKMGAHVAAQGSRGWVSWVCATLSSLLPYIFPPSPNMLRSCTHTRCDPFRSRMGLRAMGPPPSPPLKCSSPCKASAPSREPTSRPGRPRSPAWTAGGSRLDKCPCSRPPEGTLPSCRLVPSLSCVRWI